MIPSGRSYIIQRSPKLLLGDRWPSHKQQSYTYAICSNTDTTRSPFTGNNCSLSPVLSPAFLKCISSHLSKKKNNFVHLISGKMLRQCWMVRPIKFGKKKVQGGHEGNERRYIKPIYNLQGLWEKAMLVVNTLRLVTAHQREPGCQSLDIWSLFLSCSHVWSGGANGLAYAIELLHHLHTLSGAWDKRVNRCTSTRTASQSSQSSSPLRKVKKAESTLGITTNDSCCTANWL